MGYFKPWRRKIGVVTLVMAVVLAIGWIRSISLADYGGCGGEVVPGEFHDIIVTGSVRQTLFFHIIDRRKFPPLSEMKFYWTSEKISDTSPHVGNMSDFANPGQKVWGLFGFAFGSPLGSDELHFSEVELPYWMVTILLSLLSAFLLLSKPRKSNQKKITEPIPSEGK